MGSIDIDRNLPCIRYGIEWSIPKTKTLYNLLYNNQKRKQKSMNKLIEKIDSKLDEAGKLTAFIRKLSDEEVKEYYQSLADRKAEYEVEGKCGWTYIYQHQNEYVPSLAKLSVRYRVFSALVSKVANEDNTTKAKPLDKACNAYNKLTDAQKKSFLKVNKLKAA